MLRDTRTITDLEADLVGVEAQISLLRGEQHVLVNELDKAQAHHSDASRSMVEWVQSHLDVKADTAKDLVFAARRFKRNRGIYDTMVYGGATFDRTVAVVKLADAGATSEDSSSGHVTVFVDARRDNPVETTAEVEYGPRVALT